MRAATSGYAPAGLRGYSEVQQLDREESAFWLDGDLPHLRRWQEEAQRHERNDRRHRA